MQVESLDPFVRAIFSVFEALTGESPVRGPLSIRNVSTTTQQVTITLDLDGEVKGIVLYGMSVVTAQKIAFELIGKPIKEMDETAWKAIGEFGDIIGQRALDHLHQSCVTCKIGAPVILRGIGVEAVGKVPAIVMPVATKFGRVEIDIALEDSLEPTCVDQADQVAALS